LNRQLTTIFYQTIKKNQTKSTKMTAFFISSLLLSAAASVTAFAPTSSSKTFASRSVALNAYDAKTMPGMG
jgi:hypothetical protein